MKIHQLKTYPESFEATKAGFKTAELRFNDRGFRQNDLLMLEEWDPNKEAYTNRSLMLAVLLVTAGGGYGLAPNHVMLSTMLLGRNTAVVPEVATVEGRTKIVESFNRKPDALKDVLVAFINLQRTLR